jgi:CheY-like chemotaxis protein
MTDDLILMIDDELEEIRKSEVLRTKHSVLSAVVVDLVFAHRGDSPMGRQSGLLLIDQIKRRYPELPIIALTAHASNRSNQEAMQRGAFCLVTKGQADTLPVLGSAISLAVDLVRTKRPVIVPSIITAIAMYYLAGKLGLIGNYLWLGLRHRVSAVVAATAILHKRLIIALRAIGVT